MSEIQRARILYAIIGLMMEGATWQRMWVASRSSEWLTADSQQVLESQETEFHHQHELSWKQFSPEPPDENSAQMTPLFEPGDTLSREPSSSMLDLQPTELGNGNTAGVIWSHWACGNLLDNNRKLKQVSVNSGLVWKAQGDDS